MAAALLVAAFGGPVVSAPRVAVADTAPPDASLPATVSSDPLPTAQINGVIWSQVVVGNTVFVGGTFDRARPAGAAAGTQEVVRSNLMSYTLDTGVMTNFAPTLNGTVEGVTASPDGTRLYVVGRFTTVNGQTRNRVAAFDITGLSPVLTGFAPIVNSTVLGAAATNTTLYIGGNFTSVNGVTRSAAAGITVANGPGTLTGFDPVAGGGSVRQVILSPLGDKVVLGGNFTTMNGSSNPGYGLAMLNPTNGDNLPMPVNTLIRNAGSNSAIYSLAGNASGFYGTGYVFSQSGGNLEGAFKADWNGNFQWVEDCHGDSYSVFPSGNEVYVAGHPHYCGNIGGFPQTDPREKWTYQRGLAFTDNARGTVTRDPYAYFNFEGNPRPALLHWFPDLNTGTFTGQTQGPWSVSGNSNYVVYGGEFTRVNNKPQQGLVRFARTHLATNKDGPKLAGSLFVPTATNFAPGIRISWPANDDRDNEQLSYALIKDRNVANPIPVATDVSSTFWRRPNIAYLDKAVTAGQTYRYQVRATDPKGNVALSNEVTITAATGPALSTYDQVALSDGPQSYWPYNETSGTTAADIAGGSPGTVASGVTRGVPGAVPDSSTAYRFPGNTTGFVSTTGTARRGPQNFSVETWFKTSSSKPAGGGKLIGFGNQSTGSSTSYDRHMYLSATGQIYFGVNPSARVINSGPGYNDGEWHHAVATLSPAGLYLYVDGKQAASNPSVVKASEVLDGYWRVGGDAIGNWPGSAGTTGYFAGDIDSPAVYPVALTPSEVEAHFAARAGTPVNQSPVASFTSTAQGLTASFDAAGSSDPDGQIRSYTWDFGDGESGTGIGPSHVYDSAGTYSVKLSVTDDDGATGTVTRSVTVSATNQGPTASFPSPSCTDLACTFDGSGSSDSDGTITAYAWDFGDGTPAGSGAKPSHTFAAAGSYTVRLTVTDNSGGTGTTTRNVSVSASPVSGYVSDQFARTVSNGLGTAPTGGPWTFTGSAGNLSADGATGNIRLSAGVTQAVYLASVSAPSSDTVLRLGFDEVPTGGGVHLTAIGRRVSGQGAYGGKAKVASNGSVSLELIRQPATGPDVVIQPGVAVSGVTYAKGDTLNLRVQVLNTTPTSTTIRARAWKAGTPEPTTWQRSITDTTSGLQTAGSVGVNSYVSGSATAPLTIKLDELTVVAAP
jgi:PKD repeat protein